MTHGASHGDISINIIYLPGNNATATKPSRDCSLWRQEGETRSTFIKRLDTENALLGCKQEDYVLNNILFGASDPDYEPIVIIGIVSRRPYETVSDMLLHALPRPA